jgi:micrococcal nuclease
MARSRAGIVVLGAALVGSAGVGWWLGGQEPAATSAVVVEVIDGDTIVVELAGGERDIVRLLGVDTPETKDPDRPVGCYGPEASAFTGARLLGRRVRLERDAEPRDQYDRRLAYVVLDGERFNDELLRFGYARLLVIAPNVAHARTMLRAELAARAAGVGLWSACGTRG